MRKIIFNFHSNGKPRRMDVYSDLPFCEQIVYSILYLHTAKLISLDNVLSIRELVA